MNRDLIRVALPDACRRAAKILRDHPDRWMQKSLVHANQHGVYRACAVGWVTAEVEDLLGLEIRGEDRQYLAQIVAKQLASASFGSVENWNDRAGRTVGEVCDRLDQIADKLTGFGR